MLRIARLAAGIGAGMIGAAGTAAAASSVNPQRVFAIVSVSWGVVAAIPPILIPYATVPFGAMGGYFGLAGLTVTVGICAMIIFRITLGRFYASRSV